MDARTNRFDMLRSQVEGRAYVATDPEYAAHTGGFNAAVRDRPDVVVAARCAPDVVASVQCAADAGMPVSVRCSGHGAGPSTVGGMLLSTREMRGVSVDPKARTATVQAGARWRDVFEATTPHGLGGLCGSTSDVGVVGFTLGGGLPVLGRAYGYACDQVGSMEVVTADARVLTVDATSEPELFWALRGGCGAPAVITSMTFGLKDIDDIYGGGIIFDGSAAEPVLSAYAAWAASLPQDMCTSLAFLRLPPLPDVPEPLRGRFTMHLRVAYPGTARSGEALVAPMRSCAPVVMEQLGTMPYAALDAIHMDPHDPVPFDEAGVLVDELTTDVQSLLLQQAGPDTECPFLLVEVRHLGGALHGGDTPVGHRDAGFHLLAVEVPVPGASMTGGPARFRDALAPHTTGCFANLRGGDGSDEVRRASWSAADYERLQRVVAAYDPHGVFDRGRGAVPDPAA